MNVFLVYISVKKSMHDTTTTVYFRQTGETFHVPISSIPTVRDVIQYVCEKSVCRAKIDDKNYYLASSNNEELFDDKRVEDLIVSSEEILEFKLCKKNIDTGTANRCCACKISRNGH